MQEAVDARVFKTTIISVQVAGFALVVIGVVEVFIPEAYSLESLIATVGATYVYVAQKRGIAAKAREHKRHSCPTCFLFQARATSQTDSQLSLLLKIALISSSGLTQNACHAESTVRMQHGAVRWTGETSISASIFVHHDELHHDIPPFHL